MGIGGADGTGYIQLGKNKDGKRTDAEIIVSVKGGKNPNPGMVRDLIGTMKSENAEPGVFVCLEKPTKMMEAAAKTGSSKAPLGERYPKLQIYSISSHFNGIIPNLPYLKDFLKAPKSEVMRVFKPPHNCTPCVVIYE